MGEERDGSIGTKKRIVQALENNDLPAVVAIGMQNRGVVSQLIRLAYDKDTLVGWRSIVSIGLIARGIIDKDYEFLRVTIRKLLWSLSDESGGVGWSAPEILGEIVSANPVAMGDVVPLIAEVFSIEERTFRPGVLYALKRIGEVRPESIQPFSGIVLQGMADPDPLCRAFAVQVYLFMQPYWSDGEQWYEVIEKIKKDSAVVWLYRNDGFKDFQLKDMI